MSAFVASLLVTSLAVYLTLGLVVAVPFVVRGVGRVDRAAAAGTWGFRLLILPGATALWPLVLRRWLRGGGPPEARDAHRDLARSGGAR
ncbi:MAG: hypothetical protein ACRD0X_02575 [Thermoanaerobaculia bacterium]